jgi:hypothetical protein
MKKGLEHKQLKRIAGIRKLQRDAAEIALAHANSTLLEEIQALKDQEREAARIEKHWAEAVSAPYLRLESAWLWSQAGAQKNASIQRRRGAVDTATAARHHNATALHAAELRCDIADRRVEDAARERLQELDESMMERTSDLYLHRWRNA